MQPKILKKIDYIDYSKKIDEVSDHQLLPKIVKAGESISRDKKMEKTTYSKFLPTSLKPSDWINSNKKLEESKQNLLSKSPPMVHYISHETFPIATEEVSPEISWSRNPSLIKEGNRTRPSIGTFNDIERSNPEHDRALSSHHTRSPRCQSIDNHKESGDYSPREAFCGHFRKATLLKVSDSFNCLESEQQEASNISDKCPSPSFATTVPNSSHELSRILNKSPRKTRKIKTPRTTTKTEKSRLHSNSYFFNYAESLDRKPDVPSSNNWTSSPVTVGRNFMNYLAANYSHGTFNPNPNRLAARLILNPEEGFESPSLFNDKLTHFPSSYKYKATNPITIEKNKTLPKTRKIKMLWAMTKTKKTHLYSYLESFDCKSKIAFSNSWTPSSMTVGHNFMDYFVTNYFDGIFNPYQTRLAS